MNTIFRYNPNAKYSTKDLKGAYNSINFSLLNIYLDEKRTSVKTQLPNIFKDHQIIAKWKPTIAGDKWPLSLSLQRKFCNSHGQYKPERNEYFYMYQFQLNFTMFCVTCFVFLGNILIIRTYLYALFIDYMCIFMYD